MGGVEAVDVEAEVHAIARGAGDLVGLRHRPGGAVLPDLLEPDHGDAVLTAVLELRARVHPARDPDQGDLRRIEPRVYGAGDRAAVAEQLPADVRRGVEVRVDQDQPGVGVQGTHGAHGWNCHRVLAAERHRQGARAQDLLEVSLRALERASGIAGDDRAVAAVDRRQRLDDVEAEHGVVGQELDRDVADAAGPVVRAGAADVRGVEGDPVDRGPRLRRPQRGLLGLHVRESHERAGESRVEEARPHCPVGGVVTRGHGSLSMRPGAKALIRVGARTLVGPSG